MNPIKAIAILFLVCSLSSAKAYNSGIAIETQKPSQMLVLVNGKQYSKSPVNFVRVKSLPGLFHVEVRVLSPFDKNWHIIRKDIVVEKGFEFYYKVEFDRLHKPYLKEFDRYPVYSRYFLNPDLYNRHPVS